MAFQACYCTRLDRMKRTVSVCCNSQVQKLHAVEDDSKTSQKFKPSEIGPLIYNNWDP
jgi:hypothetical protein